MNAIATNGHTSPSAFEDTKKRSISVWARRNATLMKYNSVVTNDMSMLTTKRFLKGYLNTGVSIMQAPALTFLHR
ncbi:hypothetical protein S101258_02918 [Lactiplantibacillus plantarum subsp. plantarum]|uniref:Uncharacterized protein n=1 Tax=Lactiplantibacillus plantarum subsp. plantarum TaxID=337330 RepID=A0A2S3U1Y2_LACPN|nr:hypothetical protein S101258_02918 [Lactiplantibacillus plantarum subsp. plantarum]